MMRPGTLIRQRAGKAVTLVVRVGLGSLFVWSSLPKIARPYDFLSNVYEYELVGPKLGMLTAMVLPWLELLVGLCLLGGIFAGGALLATVLLATMFTFVQAYALYRGLNISCGCFSTSSSDLISYTTLIRTCGLAMLAAITLHIAVRSSSDIRRDSKWK